MAAFNVRSGTMWKAILRRHLKFAVLDSVSRLKQSKQRLRHARDGSRRTTTRRPVPLPSNLPRRSIIRCLSNRRTSWQLYLFKPEIEKTEIMCSDPDPLEHFKRQVAQELAAGQNRLQELFDEWNMARRL